MDHRQLAVQVLQGPHNLDGVGEAGLLLFQVTEVTSKLQNPTSSKHTPAPPHAPDLPIILAVLRQTCQLPAFLLLHKSQAVPPKGSDQGLPGPQVSLTPPGAPLWKSGKKEPEAQDGLNASRCKQD